MKLNIRIFSKYHTPKNSLSILDHNERIGMELLPFGTDHQFPKVMILGKDGNNTMYTIAGGKLIFLGDVRYTMEQALVLSSQEGL